MTVIQIQHLLCFLGYDTGGCDGTYGPKTEQAARDFQMEFGGLKVDGDAGKDTTKALQKAVWEGWQRPKANDPPQDTPRTEGNIPAWWKDIRYFTRNEFRCHCGKCGGFPVEPDERLVRAAEKVRGNFGKPMIVSSGVRCNTHNARVGGVSNSRHLSGKAMDFAVSGIPASLVLPYVQHLTGIRYSYAIDSSYIHMDVE